jgi:tripartite-type tricarboxylate transporter receptor subunit TctC
MKLFGLLFGLVLLANTNVARAQQDWPQRPITSIGPFAAGGGADIALRAIATYIKDHLGQPFLATNKPGGGSTAAAIEMLSKPADGYTVAALMSSGYVPEIYKHFYEVPYTSKDLVPVVRLVTFPFAFYVHASSPWKTMADFVRDVKANPGKHSYGHTGRGVHLHLIPAAMINGEGLKIREVPTKGAAEVMQMLLGKHIDGGTSSITAGKKYLDSRELRALAIHFDRRDPLLPDVPTFQELGYGAGFPLTSMTMFVKAGTPEAIVKKLHDAVKKTLEDPRYLEVANKAQISTHYGDAAAIAKDVEAEWKAVAPALKHLGMFKD